MRGSIARRGVALGTLLLGLVVGATAAWGVAEEEPALEPTAQGSSSGREASSSGGEGSSAPGAARVARSAFTSAVVDREPVDGLDTLANDAGSVSYFTELRGLEGEIVIHRWFYEGELMSEVRFEVGAARWRVHSTKRIDPRQFGEWRVAVVAGGEVLSEERLLVVPPAD